MKYKVVMNDGAILEFGNVVFCNSSEGVMYLKDTNSYLFLAATANIKYMTKVVKLESEDDGFDEFSRWTRELTMLSERNVDHALLADLINRGIKCLPELFGLNGLSDRELAEYNLLFREKQKLTNNERIQMLTGSTS